MSYCVNCGVELKESHRECPLCGVPVVNPAKPFDHRSERTFPRYYEYISNLVERRTRANILTTVFALAIAICVLVDILKTATITWAAYPVGGIILAWVISTLPLYMKKPTAVKCVAFDAIAIIVFTGIIEYITGRTGWMLMIVLPIVIVVSVFTLAIIIIIQRKLLRKMQAAAVASGALGIIVMVAEIVTDYYISASVDIFWSAFVLVPCAALAVAFLLIDRQGRIKAELRKRLHI